MTDDALVKAPKPLDMSDPQPTWGARLRQQWLLENFFLTGEWLELDKNERLSIKKHHREFYSIGESAAQQDFHCASMIADYLTHDHTTLVRVSQSRLERESVQAVESRDRVAAIQVLLRSLGALNGNAKAPPDPNGMSDDEIVKHMVQQLRHPDKLTRKALREAFEKPGRKLERILNQWLERNTITAETR